MSRRRILLAGLLVVALCAPMSASAVDTTQEPAPAIEAPVAEATDEARQLRRELASLALAWEEGGGRFGYPYWEKAGQRRAARQISTAVFREYVTGYRDRMRAGCELLDATEVEQEAARDVRRLALDACRSRADALRDQQEWLDELLRRDGSEERSESDEEALQERIAELQDAWESELQDSFRDARLALDLAQRVLDDRGLDRLAEDAFV